MWPFGGSSDKDPKVPTEKPATSPAATPESFDPKRLPERRQLPKNLQQILDKDDKDENAFDELVSG